MCVILSKAWVTITRIATRNTARMPSQHRHPLKHVSAPHRCCLRPMRRRSGPHMTTSIIRFPSASISQCSSSTSRPPRCQKYSRVRPERTTIYSSPIVPNALTSKSTFSKLRQEPIDTSDTHRIPSSSPGTSTSPPSAAKLSVCLRGQRADADFAVETYYKRMPPSSNPVSSRSPSETMAMPLTQRV
jgi:hypothetical protein